MPTAKPKKPQKFPGLRLTKADRATVASMLTKGTWPARALRRARILQLLDQGWQVRDVMLSTGSYPHTIRKIGYRYLSGGLDEALNDRPRPGARRRLDKRQEVRVVAMVCGAPPSGRARWSVRLATVEASKRGIVDTVGRETIRLVLSGHDLKPWRKKNVVRPRAQR
jgi:transposase